MAQVSPRSVQLIADNGDFNVDGLDEFVCTSKLADRGHSYSVVTIIGPQSSGKSTLMNKLFGTEFKEMDAFEGRSQTTKGIWIAKCAGNEPFIIAMDLEGSDGRERGEDDTAFEKQTALFAMAISDVVLINIWCHDIGREHAAIRPLLKTVFQVMMRLFSPRKTTLLFVLRDKTKTPFDKLKSNLKEDIKKIWEAVPKPRDHESTPLDEFFNVEVSALPSYEEKEEEFKEQVAKLRQEILLSISPGGLAANRQRVAPGSGFSLNLQEIWKLIKENKDLNLPALKVMVATVRCEEIANEKLSLLSADKGWLALKEAVQVGPVPGFGRELSSILDTYLSNYDNETIGFEEDIRNRKRQDLESKAIHIFHSAYDLLLDHLLSEAFASFENGLKQLLNEGEAFAAAVHTCLKFCLLEFDQGCADAAIRQSNWDASRVREELLHHVHEHASSVRRAMLSEIEANHEEKLAAALTKPVKHLLRVGCKDSWPSVRRLLAQEIEGAVLELSNVIAGFELDQATIDTIVQKSNVIAAFELDQATIDTMLQKLRSHARGVVEEIAREEAGKVLIHMKERFSAVFNHDNSMPRVWTGKEDIRIILKNAHSTSLSVLSDLAVIRLDEKPDKVKKLLFSSLMGRTVNAVGLASNTWEEVSPNDMLKSPLECNDLWEQFKKETMHMFDKAKLEQKAHKRRNNLLPSPVALVMTVAAASLGFAIDVVSGNP